MLDGGLVANNPDMHQSTRRMAVFRRLDLATYRARTPLLGAATRTAWAACRSRRVSPGRMLAQRPGRVAKA